MSEADVINQVAWGRVLERLDSIKHELHEIRQRITWRLDNIEARVEVLEQKASGLAPYTKVVERTIWVLVCAGVAAGVKVLG